MYRRFSFFISAAVAIFFAVFFAASLPATGPSEDEVKAAFVFNFAKFIEWPKMNSRKNLLVCFTGENPLSGNLALLEGRDSHGLVIQVSPWAPDKKDDCDILFLQDDDRKSLSDTLNSLAARPILTVSDAAGFAKSGGMIGLIVVDNKVRFEINLAVANKAFLKISSQLLSLAKEVVK